MPAGVGRHAASPTLRVAGVDITSLYADGMSLYESRRGGPTLLTDPDGLIALGPGLGSLLVEMPIRMGGRMGGAAPVVTAAARAGGFDWLVASLIGGNVTVIGGSLVYVASAGGGGHSGDMYGTDKLGAGRMPRGESGTSSSGGGGYVPPHERPLSGEDGGDDDGYDSPEGAIGYHAFVNGIRLVGQGTTSDQSWIQRGYVSVHYFRDMETATKYTVMYNPSTRRWNGAHESSGQ